MFRVQKILLAEYDEVYEPVLVENPMVLVDGRGYGLRQYYMGLTCNLLIFGCDRIVEPTEMPTYRSTDVDSEIECFDLVCMLPLQCLRFHFYRKGSRYLMMVTALQPSGQPLDGAMEPMIFEFGGHLYRQHYWHTWRERVASIRVMQPHYNQITGHSPFSSTDVLLEEIITVAQVHRVPQTPSTMSSCGVGF